MLVLLAVGQPLVREGLKRVALEIDARCEFVHAAEPAMARISLQGASAVDAAWFDENFFPDAELAALRQNRPQLTILALVESGNADASARMLAVGVNALVPRSAPIEVLGAALRLALAGDVSVRAREAICGFAGTAARSRADPRSGTGPLNLTSRQYDVLERLAQGRSNKAIGNELGIGLRTVKGHVSVILRALHADNRFDAGHAARRWLASTAPAIRTKKVAEPESGIC